MLCDPQPVCQEGAKANDAQQPHPAQQAQQHLLKVRELMVPSAVPEPDEDQTEAFLAAAERGNTTKLRRVRLTAHLMGQHPVHPPPAVLSRDMYEMQFCHLLLAWKGSNRF